MTKLFKGSKKRILILYTEIAGYTLACINELRKYEVEIYLIRWEVNKEAPFQFNFNDINETIRGHYSNDIELMKYCKEIKPDILLVSGWLDNGYLKVARYFYGKIPTILTMDNNWKGSLRQVFSTWISPFFIRNKFSHVWVPGIQQKIFANKLGYSDEKIMTGFYSCDRELFHTYYKNNKDLKSKNYPKVFLFVGRYVKAKGISNLWDAFIELDSEYENDWELWCVGTGEEFINKVNHPKIKHFGFVQPEDFEEIIQKTSIYILPSEFEPWGVSLHEFVSAGFPIIVSDKVGSSEIFAKEGKNGFIVRSGSKESIKEGLRKFMKMNKKELLLMSEESVSLSEKITPKIWANKLISLL